MTARPTDPVAADVLERAAEHLAARYQGTFSTESVHAPLGESYRLLAENAHIHRYLPVLAVHFATDPHCSGGSVTARSAGSASEGEIDPTVIQALHGIGIDASNAYPKPLTDEVIRAADTVVTMGCGDACPIHPGKRYLDWHLPDPEGRSIDEVRAIRDQIGARVKDLLTELLPHPTA